MPRNIAVCGMTLSADPGVELADRNQPGFDRIDAARDDRLRLRDDMRADQHRVDALVRLCGMRAEALDLDDDAIGRGEQRARPDRELADRKAGHVVHAVDLLDAEALHHAVLDHLAAAAAALFGGLEDHHGGAGEVARLGEIFRGAEQHRGVPVMAAGVHLARVGRAVREVCLLIHRQRVHVGAQPDGFAAAALRPRMTPTTPVLPMPVTTSSQPKALSFSATLAAVRCTSNRISGWAWMSRRHAATSACMSAIRSTMGMENSVGTAGRVPRSV